jgi:DNA-binding MarR family transcriptional regulator
MSSIMRDKVDIVKQSNTPDAGVGGDSLELLHAVMHLYRSQQFQALRDGPHGLTHMDSKVLGFFSRHPQATLSDLALHSGRDKAQLARLVAGLRERGLLHGEADPQDKRSVQLTLTTEGQAVQRALKQQARRLSARAVAGLGADELQQLQALLLRVRDNLAGG